MSYKDRKWMVCLQDDGVLKAMNGWYYICDSDGGIMLGYFKDKKVAEEVVSYLNIDVCSILTDIESNIDSCSSCGNLLRPNGGYCYIHKNKPKKVPCSDFNPPLKIPSGSIDKDGNKLY